MSHGRMSHRPARLLGVGVTALTLVAAACGGGSGKSTASTSPSTQRASTSAPPTRPSTTVTTVTTAAPTTTAPPNLAAVHVALRRVVSGLDSPVAIAWRRGDARMYVAEQSGRVRIVDNGRVLGTPVLTVDVSHGNEQGLLGIAFSADGTKLYTDRTDPHGDTRVEEYTMRGDVADPASRRLVLFVAQPFPNHNGGEVLVGPDGMLYVTLGDGGSEGDPNNTGQNLGTLLGKILRIDPRASGSAAYTIPPDNPFVGRAGARPEIWMYGLRNPWRFSFDTATRDIWIGDVGQDKYEEIDYASAGSTGINWGWSRREGFHAYKGAEPPGARDPLLETRHSDGNCAITGGYVYRGKAIPSLAGAYVFGDFCLGHLEAATQRNGRLDQQRDLGLQVSQLTTFGQDPSGELYAASRGGSISQIVPG